MQIDMSTVGQNGIYSVSAQPTRLNAATSNKRTSGAASTAAAQEPATDRLSTSAAATADQDASEVPSQLDQAAAFTETQQAYLQQLAKNLASMKDMSAKAQQPDLSSELRASYETQFQQLSAKNQQIAQQDYQGIKLFDDGSSARQSLSVEGRQLTATVDLGGAGLPALGGGASLQTPDSSATAQAAIDQTQQTVQAYQNSVQNSEVSLNNLKSALASKSGIPDPSQISILDKGTAEANAFSAKMGFLSQSAGAMLAQANLTTDRVNTLLT
jgi:hypothetical protein